MPESIKTKSMPSGTWERARAATKKIGDWYLLIAAPDIPLLPSVRHLKQIHGGNIIRAEEINTPVSQGDGIWLEKTSLSVAIRTADCLPLTIISQKGALIMHISRKSLVRGLLDNALTYFSPSDIDHVYIGPHICQLHLNYEEEGYLLRLFRFKYPEAVHYHGGKIYLSLLKAVKQSLTEWEVHPERIEIDKRCTYENQDLPSYRRWSAGGKAGELDHINTVIWRQ